MHLHPDWVAILRYAWSIRLILLAGSLTTLDVFMQIFVGIGTPTVTVAILAGLASGAALVARVVAQKDVP
jgi:hypothetical protein